MSTGEEWRGPRNPLSGRVERPTELPERVSPESLELEHALQNVRTTGYIRSRDGTFLIDPENLQILMGASDLDTGVGLALGEFGGVWGVRFGDPAGDRLEWNENDGLTIVGGATIDSGTIGGWTIGATSISSGTFVLDSDLDQIRIGATDFVTGVGFIAGFNGGVPQFRVGDPAAHYLSYDGVSTITLGGQIVTGSNIVNGAIGTVQLGDSSVTTAKLGDASVTTAKIGTSQVTSTILADGSVVEAKIGDSAVTTSKIGDDQVTTAKIGASAVTSTELATGSVVEAKIGDLAVTTSKIGDNAVTTIKIGDAAVTTDQLGDAAVTTVKINDQAVGEDQVALGVLESRLIWGWEGSDSWPTSTTIAGADTYVFDSPASGRAVVRIRLLDAEGAIQVALNGTTIGSNLSGPDNTQKWYVLVTDALVEGSNTIAVWSTSTDGGSVTMIEVYASVAGLADTTTNVPGLITADHILAGTITGDRIDANTITAGNIAAGTITTAEIAAGTIVAANIASGTITASQIAAGTITSTQIATGTIVAADIASGTITATQIASGTITATQIAAGTITADRLTISQLSDVDPDMGSITAGSIVLGSTNRIWLNDSGDGALNIGGSTKASAPFRVTAAGVLTATGASITGTIEASSVVAASSFTATSPTFDGSVRILGSTTGEGPGDSIAVITDYGSGEGSFTAYTNDVLESTGTRFHSRGIAASITASTFTIDVLGELVLDPSLRTVLTSELEWPSGDAISNILVHNATGLNFGASVAAGSESSQVTVTVTGAAAGDIVLASLNLNSTGLGATERISLHARISAANTVALWCYNGKGTSEDMSDYDVDILVFKT